MQKCLSGLDYATAVYACCGGKHAFYVGQGNQDPSLASDASGVTGEAHKHLRKCAECVHANICCEQAQQ